MTFSGGCVATHTKEARVTVTTGNKITLEELPEDSTFDFKVSPDQKAHPGNHYATPDTNSKMNDIAAEYYRQYNEKLVVNDMGLVWGGRYRTNADINGEYNYWVNGTDHVHHRYGRQIDIRSWNIAQKKRACFKEIACKYGAQPILEGKAVGTLGDRDYSGLSVEEMEALDKTEHYHLNFRQIPDPTVNPPDDKRTVCNEPQDDSVCPKPFDQEL